METVTVQNPFTEIIEKENHVGENTYSRVDVRFADLLRYESVNRWLRKREPRTKYEYLNRFEKFFQWSKARINVENPDQLLAWAKATEGTTVSDVIEEYNEDKGVSNGQMGMAVLRSFLRRNGYNGLPKVDWESTLSFVEGYSRQEIQSLLSYLDSPFQKLYVNVCKDSGLRSNDVLAIQYRNIQPDIEDPKQDHVEIHFEKEAYLRKKAPGRGAFLGPNSLDILRQLIKDGRVSAKPDAKIFRFTYRTITESLNWAKDKAKLRKEIRPSHGFRAFYKNCLDMAVDDEGKKFSEAKKSQMEGHSIGIERAYTSQNREEFRQMHKWAYKYLDLNETALVPQIVLDLQKQDDEKTKIIESLKQQLSEKENTTQNRLADFDARLSAVMATLQIQDIMLDKAGYTGLRYLTEFKEALELSPEQRKNKVDKLRYRRELRELTDKVDQAKKKQSKD